MIYKNEISWYNKIKKMMDNELLVWIEKRNRLSWWHGTVGHWMWGIKKVIIR